MMITRLKSKLHGATVTATHLSEDHGIRIDAELLDAGSLGQFEQVHVLGIGNGVRFVTYATAGARGSGEVVLTGADARLVEPGDKIIVLAYAVVDAPRDREGSPPVKIVHLDPRNLPI